MICVSGERRRPWSRQDGDRRAGEGERVGGLGSGRRRTGLGVDECRTLEVGELCDRGRWLTQPRGEVLWRSMQGGETRGRLTYVISRRGGDTGELRLTYRYAHQGANLSFEHEVELDCSPGKRSYLSCPRCGARVRTLYAPLGAEFFACRSCYGLVYRRSGADDTLAYLAEVAGPAMRELRALPKRTRRQPRRRYVVAPPAALARELEAQPPEGESELRLWCLRLRAAGLSYRQIAALVDSSKSSVARYCADGRSAIDVTALTREGLQRAWVGPVAPTGDDRGSLDIYLRAMHHHALRLGLYHHPLSETEERVVIVTGDAAQF